MKIISWNVNGLKSIIDNELNSILKTNADIICLQETKIAKPTENINIKYNQYHHQSKKAGYSGVAIFSKEKAENIIQGIEIENEYGEPENVDDEGRVLTAEYNDFFIVNVYVPCSQTNIDRRNERYEFDTNLRNYIEKLNQTKNVIICGDFNVCHKNIDICNIDKHKHKELFSDEERGNFDELLEIGLIDTYRYMHPQMRRYTFWQHKEDRETNKWGWRLDYILVSNYLRKNIREANILSQITGSDHCPIELIMKENLNIEK